jgi:2-polyprenyl-3-methyl-5-hydroxy-6-metoxy-1,4-benzoquinol methylase
LVLTNPRPEDDHISSYYQSQDYISHTNKASSLIDWIYLRARKYTLSWKLRIINTASSKSKTLLDYGCGTGAFLQYCQQHDWNVQGIEPSAEARSMASKIVGRNIVPDINQLTDLTYDVITLWHVLEHVPDLNGTIQKLKDKLTDNGTMFIAVPNHTSWDGKRYREHWAGYDVPRHLWHFSQSTMKTLFAKNDLKVVGILPMKLDAYYISLLSEKYKRQNTSVGGMITAFVNGFRSNLNANHNNEYSSLIYVIKK